MCPQPMQPPFVNMYLGDLMPYFAELADAEIGQITKACAAYWATGEIPDFGDRAVRAAWHIAQSMIDKSFEAYNRARLQNAYKVHKRECKKNGVEPIPAEAWTFDAWRDWTRQKAAAEELEEFVEGQY